MTQQTEREKFEAWATHVLALAREGDAYQDGYTQTVWEAWQARAALEAKQAVQWPEPVAYLHECGKKPSLRSLEFSKVVLHLSARGYKSTPLYTEQQVRAILKRGFPVSNGESNDD